MQQVFVYFSKNALVLRARCLLCAEYSRTEKFLFLKLLQVEVRVLINPDICVKNSVTLMELKVAQLFQ